MTVWLLSRLNTEKRALRSTSSIGSVQVTLAPRLVTHGMRPNAPRSLNTSSRLTLAQLATHSQPDPPPLNSPGPKPRLSLGQRTPNAVIGPPERDDRVAPKLHISLSLKLPRSLIWCR